MTIGSSFRTVLVANRGEIAARIVRGVQAMGLRALVLHHAADRAAPALRMADGVIELTGGSPVAAFLDGRQIIQRALAAGAEAVHPGYGFLAENANFAGEVASAGMVFVGPTADCIALMGDKVGARRFVAAQGLPVAEGAVEADDPASFSDRARALSLPLLVKPAGGGGGKGMHIVRDLDELEPAIEMARREGLRYFNDGSLYVERYIERPRHIEVQILADHHGNVLHLFERECSLQRRFQKLVEEAPAPTLAADERAAICQAAVDIARACAYRNAGTVEFIRGASGFYFLEMNTRLQVEHPVTEGITGLDLVAEQLRIAGGDVLGFTQADVPCHGHAIEVRICAEDADRAFSPCNGEVLRWQPAHGAGIRVDAGIEEGSAIGTAFDPMLAKLIAHGSDRATAMDMLDAALYRTILLGCHSNIAFLRRLLQLPAVRNGDLHTGLIAESVEALRTPDMEVEEIDALIAVAALSSREVCAVAGNVPRLHAGIGAWQN